MKLSSYMKNEETQLRHCPEESYFSLNAAHHAHRYTSEVSATILIDSQAHPPYRESVSTDFSLIPEWRLSQRVVKSHDQKVDRAIHCITILMVYHSFADLQIICRHQITIKITLNC